MKAYWIAPGPGGAGVELRETATPEPKAGEILVRVRAASLNRGELLGGKPGAPARPGGGECAGEVVACGECLRALAFEGRLATVGHLDRVLSAPLDLETLHAKRLTVFGVSNRLRAAAQRAETVRGFVRDLLPRFEEGRLRPVVDRVFEFADLPAAITFMESDAQVGKIVVRV